MTNYAIFYLRSTTFGSLPGETIFVAGGKKYISLKVVEQDIDPLQTPGTFWFTVERYTRVYTGTEIRDVDIGDEPSSYMDVATRISRIICLLCVNWLGKREPMWLRVYYGKSLPQYDQKALFNSFLQVDIATLSDCNDEETRAVFDYWIASLGSAVHNKKITVFQSRELIGSINALAC